MRIQPAGVSPLIAIALLFLFPNNITAQQPASESGKVDPAVTSIAARLAESLHMGKAKRIALFDLHGPEREVHPVGKWLADELAKALIAAAPDLQLVDRTKLGSIDIPKDKLNDAAEYQFIRELAKRAGADSFVQGGFAGLSDRIGITLSWQKLNGRKSDVVTGAVPISEEILALSTKPIPTFSGDAPRAATGGVTSPKCKSCPLPEYSDKARAAKYQGEELLDVIVTAEGTTERVIVIRGSGYGLEEKAIEAVKRWRFRPAVDVDGRPVRVRVEIEVTFKLF